MSDGSLAVVCVGCVIISFIIGLATGMTSRISFSDAVTHGCAEYNSTTGDFQWKDGNP